MTPQNQAVLDEIMREVRTYTITQRRALLRAMRNHHFATISSRLAVADERDSNVAAHFILALTQRNA